MTYLDVARKIMDLGYAISYGGRFRTPPPVPYLVVTCGDSDDVMADNQNYVDIGGHTIELYMENKNLAVEKEIEDVFRELRLPFYKSEVGWIEGEDLFRIDYEFQLIGG